MVGVGMGVRWDHHPPSCRIHTVQAPGLVLEQTEGREGRKIQPGPGQWSGQQARWRLSVAEEDSSPQGAAATCGVFVLPASTPRPRAIGVALGLSKKK